MAFFIPVFILLITGIIFLAVYSKESIHISLNAWYHPFFDGFFKYGTYLGDGLVFVPAAIVLAFIRWRYLIGIVFTGLITLLITGFLKQVVYEGEPRPARFFEDRYELRLVEGVEMHHHNSYPSGHTTTGFACYGFLALLFARHWLKFLCFAVATMIGYSRIYLSQHFLEDVLAGATIGSLAAIAGYYIMLWIKWPPQNSKLRFRGSKKP